MTKLKMIRIKKEIKQTELAQLLKKTRAAVSYAEKIGIRSVNSAKKYAKALNCNPEDLIEW